MTLHDVSAPVLRPGDPGWDAARLFHSGIGEPDAIVRPRTVDEVAATVRAAAAEGLPVVVRSGGHSAWGSIPGGITVDLAAFADVGVEGELVRVGGGAMWGAVAAELAEHGLGVSSGDTGSVGVGGLTLGGGIGWMVRAWGLACDQLVGMQMVTATGEVVEVSASSHPELFWALRGGGGNFGVVTRLDFRAHPLPAVVFATLSVTGDAAPVLRALRNAMADAPRALTATFMDVPPMDPSAPAGATVTACWIGDDEEAARAALAPVLAVDGVAEVELGVRRYADVLLEMPAYDPVAPPPDIVGGNVLLSSLTDAAVDDLVAFRARFPASVVFLRSLGGAYGDVGEDDTAFGARDATWFAMAGAFAVPDLLDEEGAADARARWAAIEAGGVGSYGNFTMSTDPAWVPRMYRPATLARLRAAKREWDPANVFSRTHNVLPA